MKRIKVLYASSTCKDLPMDINITQNYYSKQTS